MGESSKEKEKRLNREIEGKTVAYYKTLVSAWVGTNMELDKALLTLSTAGIGVLVTIITTKGLIVPWGWAKLSLLLAFVGFLTTACLILCVFKKNAHHLEKVVRNLKRDPSDEEEKGNNDKNRFNVLGWLDMGAYISFSFALLFTALFGLIMTFNFYVGGENKMTDDKIPVEKSTIKNNSLDGVRKLDPSTVIKSLQGIENLAPTKPAQTGGGTGSSGAAQTTETTDSKE